MQIGWGSGEVGEGVIYLGACRLFMFRPMVILGLVALAIGVFSCAKREEQAGTPSAPDRRPTTRSSTRASTRPTMRPATRPSTLVALPDPNLHNAHRVTGNVFSGAQPDDEGAFRSLAAIGVKTIISVDSARPDAEMARKFGMRYVHLPIGYNGVTREQGMAIAKAIEELPGPFYIHCHHGKHRSAAAVAVACVYNGSLSPDHAESVLHAFGTGANYTGLWRDARLARPVGAAVLENHPVRFVEAAPIPPLAEAMVGVDRHFDHLKMLQKNKWEKLATHPDLDPPHEALQLHEHFVELGRTDVVRGKPEEFRRIMGESEAASGELRKALAAKPMDWEAAEGAFKRIGQSCAACHKAYRD